MVVGVDEQDMSDVVWFKVAENESDWIDAFSQAAKEAEEGIAAEEAYTAAKAKAIMSAALASFAMGGAALDSARSSLPRASGDNA